MIQKPFFLLLLSLISLFPITGISQSHWVDSTLDQLSLDQQIGQLFMIAAYSNREEEYEKELEETLREYHVGGLLFFQGTPERQARLTNRYQQIVPVPLMIGMDAENGVGWRLKGAIEFSQQLLLGAARDEEWAYRVGKAIGKHCRIMGVHVNFAPVVDININPRNPVIGTRSFGEDTQDVSRKAIRYIQGLADENVMAVAKHFPGHGDTDIDSHLNLPLIQHSKERLDSVELAPFKAVFAAGIPGALTAHLEIPAYEPNRLPATLSPHIVTDLLRKELGYNGLCFTDAMNMKGVGKERKKGVADLLALIAGNDVILFPEDIAASIQEIKKAIAAGTITTAFIRERCRRVLAAKERYVLPYSTPIDTCQLIERLNSPEDIALQEKIYAQAITLVKNQDDLLPLIEPEQLRMAILNFGDREADAFEKMVENYTTCDRFSLTTNATQKNADAIVKKLSEYQCVIIYNSAARNSAARQFGSSTLLSDVIRKLQDKVLILCHPSTPYGADRYSHLPLDAILIGYSHDVPAQQFMAQALFGGIAVNGKLPVSINASYPAGLGNNTPKIRLGYHLPESSGMSTPLLQRIDSLCQNAIDLKATPGCEVLVAREGYVVYHKTFGHHTYQKTKANRTGDIYDVASITKMAATLPVVMMLYDQQQINLHSPISSYHSGLAKTNKASLTIRELLMHMGGLKASFPFFQHAVDKSQLSGSLFSSRQTKSNTVKVGNNLYLNPRFQYRDSTFRFEKAEGYSLVSPHFYMHNHFRDSILTLLLNTELTFQKNYTYSDLSFILLKEIVEKVSGSPLQIYLKKQLYLPLGARNTDFLAHRTLNMERVVPAAIDTIYRKSTLLGYVHDPIAALLGGVAGNAGLFSTAGDLAKIMAMYLNHGSYGGKHYIDSTTIALFTRAQLPPEVNRRGLGFDKPENRPDKEGGPTCAKAPPSSYGHTGFTGAIAWNDPDNQLIYIFLSNRTYPDEYNSLLIKENIRTNIQAVIYDALQPSIDKDKSDAIKE